MTKAVSNEIAKANRKQSTAINKGTKAWDSIQVSARKTRDDWHTVAEALEVGRELCGEVDGGELNTQAFNLWVVKNFPVKRLAAGSELGAEPVIVPGETIPSQDRSNARRVFITETIEKIETEMADNAKKYGGDVKPLSSTIANPTGIMKAYRKNVALAKAAQEKIDNPDAAPVTGAGNDNGASDEPIEQVTDAEVEAFRAGMLKNLSKVDHAALVELAAQWATSMYETGCSAESLKNDLKAAMASTKKAA